MNQSIIKEELQYVFKEKLNDYLGQSIEDCSDDFLIKKFNEYAKKESIKIKIKDLVDNYKDIPFLLNTPDGVNEVGDFYIKKNKEIIKITTADNFSTKCSTDHKFETSLGFKFAKDITKKDLILTKDGYRKVNKITKYKKIEETYDFEVLHENHRYWSGNGISSHNTGKSFLALSICRNAINMGYSIIYFDSEGAMDVEFVRKLGVDVSKLRLQPVNTIEEVNYIISQIIKSYAENEKENIKSPKILIVLDSLGNLSSEKESEDSVNNNKKRDMTKQQEVRKLFRVNGVKLAKYGIPFIINAHIYQSIGSYMPTNEVSGGGGLKYNVSIMFMLTKKKLDDKEGEQVAKDKNVDAVRVGVTITVTPIKQRFAKPIKVELHIPFYKKPNPFVGLEKFVSWESCGVIRGKVLTEKQASKLTDAEQKRCKMFEGEKGERLYAFPKDTARTLVCKHLKGEIPLNELFTEKVFTPEILKDLDEKIIKPTFQLPDISSLEDLAELTEIINEGIENNNGEVEEEIEEINE